MNSGGELYVDFEWAIAPAHDWKDWLNANAKPVVVPIEGTISLESPAAVELALRRAERKEQETGPVLCPSAGAAKVYRPMQREHAALFRLFSALDPTDRDAIRAFANEYGRLGLPLQEQQVQVNPTTVYWAIGESHLAWAREIYCMKEAVEFEAVLSEHGTVPVRDQARLAWLINRQQQYVQRRMTFDSNGRPQFSIAPLTLLAAMWLQLSQALTGEKRFVECKFCRHLFEISTEQSGFRKHRQFCTDVCKTKDYRRRKHMALKLAARGSSLAVIADRTATSRATIRKWLAVSKVRSKPR